MDAASCPSRRKRARSSAFFQTASQQFQREAASGLKALGFVNFAHASASQQTADAVWPPGLTGSQPGSPGRTPLKADATEAMVVASNRRSRRRLPCWHQPGKRHKGPPASPAGTGFSAASGIVGIVASS